MTPQARDSWPPKGPFQGCLRARGSDAPSGNGRAARRPHVPRKRVPSPPPAGPVLRREEASRGRSWGDPSSRPAPLSQGGAASSPASRGLCRCCCPWSGGGGCPLGPPALAGRCFRLGAPSDPASSRPFCCGAGAGVPSRVLASDLSPWSRGRKPQPGGVCRLCPVPSAAPLVADPLSEATAPGDWGGPGWGLNVVGFWI